jgi:hypothetical protein
MIVGRLNEDSLGSTSQLTPENRLNAKRTMYLPDQIGLINTRRAFLGRTLAGLGTTALASLLSQSGSAFAALPATSPGGVVHPLHFTPKA